MANHRSRLLCIDKAFRGHLAPPRNDFRRDGRMITIDMRPVIQQVQQPSYRRSITAKLVSIALTTVGLRAGLSTVCEESRLQNGTRSAVSRKNVIVSSMAQGTLLPLLQGAPWQEEFWRKRSGISGPADSDETMC
jgi:hypothetical protein